MGGATYGCGLGAGLVRLIAMRWLMVSRDARLVEGLQGAAPEGACLVPVADAAGALRALHERPGVDGAVVDAGADPGAAAEFFAWWGAAPERRRRRLVVAGGGGSSLPAGAERCARDAAALAPTRARLERETGRLVGRLGVVRLTPSETALLAHLVEAGRVVPAPTLLQEALGYAPDTSVAPVRTHIGNLRRKCRAVGLGEVVRTHARRGYEAAGVALV